ncbi:unnamed protein product, partial [Polarella glacialis]
KEQKRRRSQGSDWSHEHHEEFEHMMEEKLKEEMLKENKDRFKNPHPYPRIRSIVFSRSFESFSTALILCNTFVIGWQASVLRPTEAETAINTIIEHAFTALFLIELVLRVITFGWTMLLVKENTPDVFLVVLSVGITWILSPAGFEVDLLRKLTVLRTLRLVRIARAVKHRPEFREMWSLVQGLTESSETLFWTY